MPEFLSDLILRQVVTSLAETNDLGVASATLYTANDPSILTEILFCNVNSVSATARINLVPNGGAVAADNRIVPDIAIPPSAIIVISLSTAVPALGTIRGLASVASSINVTLSGIVY